jgi:Methylamine utilisation protein MauE
MDPFLQWTLALSLAALFGAAAFGKLRALREWPGVVRNYRLLPERLAAAAAAVLPLAEVFTAAALLWTPTRPAGAIAAAALLLLFAAAIGVNIRRGRTHIDCGCFGSALRQSLAPWMVWRNLILACAALTLLLPVAQRTLTWLDGLASAGCAITLALLYPVVAVALQGPEPPRATSADGGA